MKIIAVRYLGKNGEPSAIAYSYYCAFETAVGEIVDAPVRERFQKAVVVDDDVDPATCEAFIGALKTIEPVIVKPFVVEEEGENE